MNHSHHSHSYGHSHGFSLIELLLSLGIIATLTGMSIAILNPAEMLRKGRDTQRIQELNSLKDAILLYQGEYSGTPLAPSTTTVYLSLPDTNANCSSYSLPSLPQGFSYACKPEGTYRKTDGTGWIPVNLSNLSQTIGSTPLSTLPKDPTNNTPTNYYTYTINGSNQFELNASLEAQTNTTLMVSDVGDNDLSYETGTNLAIYPIAGYQLAKTDGDNQPIYSQSDLLYAAGTSPYLPYFTDGTHLGNSGIYWNNTTSRLGINTATPNQALDVTGNINFSGSLSGGTVPYTLLTSFPSACSSGQYVTAIGATLTCGTPAGGIGGSGTANYLTKWSAATTTANSIVYDTGTNIGIGTTTPGYKFDVNGNARIGTNLDIQDSGFELGRYGTNAALMANTFSFFNAAQTTEYMRINSSGNVGIGTTTPGQKLSVAGTIESTTGGFKFPDATTQTTAAAAHGKQMFTSNGTFTVPSGVTTIWVSGGAAGGGGGGGNGGWGAAYTGGGGGGGASIMAYAITTSGGTQYAVAIGSGGTAGAAPAGTGGTGGTTSFGSVIVLVGGSGGQSSNGGTGGTVTAPSGSGVAGAAGGRGVYTGDCGFSGGGGDSLFGSGGQPAYSNAGSGYGGGGSGGCTQYYNGGVGAPGVVLVEW